MEINRFSIVASVYGVEKYLNEFFVSIVNQSISFEKHIELIVVDDGSIDDSALIIKEWQNYYPNNIKYVYKENGGLSSARNTGLKYVTTDWVSFIDPDDFIDKCYFEQVDSFLLNHQEEKIGMISCNLVYYIEAEDRFSETHALSYRFKQKVTILEVPMLKDFIQLSVNSVFLRTDVIRENDLKMDSRIKPTFEDGHFNGRYLLEITGFKIAFLRDAKYYYRKRQNNTSLIDTSWSQRDHYTTKLKYGYLDLLEEVKSCNNYIPAYSQRTVLYDLTWYVRYIVNHSERLAFLDSHDKKYFITLINKIFFHIDTEVIVNFNLAGCWFFHQVGMLGAFKGVNAPFQIVYLGEYDANKRLLLLKYYYWGDQPLERFSLDSEDTIPVYTKTRVHKFIDEVFVKERIIWLPITNEQELLQVNVGDVTTRLSFAGKHHYNGILTEAITKHFGRKELDDNDFPISVKILRRLAQSPVIIHRYRDAWLFMDRDTQADDNAEHLYQYIIQKHPDINAFFVLRRGSNDWGRLKKKGFKLIDFDSQEHKLALLNSKHLISSHADRYVTDLMSKKWYGDMLDFKYTFLQHGITQNDLSNWLNDKPISLLVTATKEEFSSFVSDDSCYKFSNKEVVLSGFPRHDTLLKLNKNTPTEKLIIIMPTWRQGLMGAVKDVGNSRNLNEEFYSSDFALKWKEILHSERLETMVKEEGYDVIFFPHVNVQPYSKWFETPDYIATYSHDECLSIQSLFSRATILMTDYSSVAFEMAYLEKSVIYYQFDRDYVFGEGHLTSKGYFDYEKDGFGPVCLEKNQVIDVLSTILENDGLPNEQYLNRMKSTFIHKDGGCCQRVYEGIRKLENSVY